MFEQFDDVGAIRCAIADVLIAVTGKRCSKEKVEEVRRLLEKAVEVIHHDTKKRQTT